jgi:hypothetical protein
MPEFPKISVVTPSFNQAPYLEQTIDSVLTQDYPNVEYLVYDGGSTDGSVDIIRKHADRLAGWRSGPDKGQTDAILQGWRAATGDWVSWLNSDDYLLPGALEKVAEEFREHPEAQVIIGTCWIVDEQGRVIGEKYARGLDLPLMLTTSGGVPGQPSVFVRREVLDKVGFPDPALRYVMDWEYWIRITLQVAPSQVRVIYRPLSAVRVWPGTKTLTGIASICEEHRQVLTRLFASGELPAALQALKAAALAGTYYKQAFLEWRAGQTLAAWRSLSKARSISIAGLSWRQFLWMHVRIWAPYSLYERLQFGWSGVRYPVLNADRSLAGPINHADR